MTRINTNVPSLVAQNRLQSSNRDLQTALTRLSTGLRINTGSDDPAGLIASEALRSEVTSLNRAVANTRRASQIISTADSALGQVSSLLNDIRGLVVEAANNGALSTDEIAANQLQIDSSLEAINRIAQTTTFQGRKLLDGGLDFLTRAGTNFEQVTSLQIDQANLGPAGTLDVSVRVTAAATQARVTIADIPVGATAAQATSALSFSRPAVTAVTGVASSGGVVPFTQSNPAVAAELDFSLGTTDFTLTADTAGVAGNDLSIAINDTGALASGIVVAKTGDDYTVTVENGLAVTAGDIVTAFNAFVDANANDVTLTTSAPTDDVTGDTLTATNLAGGAAASTSDATIDVVADATGEAGDVGITFVKVNGTTTPTAALVGSNIQITINDTGTTSLADIEAAINTVPGFTATLTNTDVPPVGDFDNTTTVPTTTALSGGVDAVAAAAAQSASIALTAVADGTAANDKTITFQEVDGVTTPTAVVTNGNLVIQVEDTDSVTLASIVAAINTEGTYTAVADTTGGLTSFDGDTDTVAPPADFAGGVDAGGLTEDVVFELLGKTGSEVFNVSRNTGIDDLIAQINLVSDATGVVATKTGQTLELTSSDFGSEAFVDLRIIREETGGTLKTAIGAGTRVAGTDVRAKVNGVDASGRGNRLSINTATLDLAITLADGADDDVDFTITGGGALFQLGGDVVSNQQARIGISSVSSSRLGGSSGLLFQLGSGETAAVATDPNSAARIVTEAINQVTGLRGRLGAFQATSLESNLVSLNDTVANLQEAESSIRDADFAQESANLTRAQILVQSGTNVLSLANQNPQNVLSLLR